MSIRGPLIAASTAAVLVFASTYYAENKDITMAGLIAAIPIAIPVTLFLNEKGAFQDWTFSFLVGMIIYVISAFSLHLFYRHGMTKTKAVVGTMIVWISLVVIFYGCIIGIEKCL